MRRYIITGNLSSRQNLLSILPWLETYYPVLREVDPEGHLLLAGKQPTYELTSLCERLGIELIPSPEDMDAVVSGADIYICPSDNGSGIKLRLMDGLKNGLPVVTHQLSTRGYEAFLDKGVYPYSDIESFRRAILSAINDATDHGQMKETYKKQFSFSAGVRRLSDLMSKVLLGLLLPLTLHSAPLRIASQEEFRGLGNEIIRQIAAGEKDIDVSFVPGTYFFPDNLISLIEVDAPGVSITLDGSGSSFLGEGGYFCNGNEAGEYNFRTGWTELFRGMPADMRGPVGLCRFYPIPTNFARTSFRIPTREKDLSEEDAKDVYVIITQWYKGIVFKVDKIKRGWIYYHETEPSLTKWYTELRFGRCLPRYQMLNRPDGEICIRDGRLHTIAALYRSDASCFLRVRSSRLGCLSIRNCCFDGNNGAEPLMFFHSVEADSISVGNCRLRGIRGDGISLYNTDNFSYSRCVADGNYGSVLFIDHQCSDISVTENIFRDNGLAFSNDPIVLCMAANMLIADNYFEDFTYSAISVGAHYTYDCGEVTSGCVRNNEICHSPSFRTHPMRSIIDGGAIYVYTQNKDLVVRDNYVHDIGGHHGNRGIFCDDGVNNVSIIGNRVENIENSYPIDLRKFDKVTRLPGSKVRSANHHNRIIGNTVDAECRLYVRKGEEGSEIRDNHIIGKK